MASAVEAEIAGLFLNARLAIPIRTALIELGHPQPATKMKTDNSTANGFIRGTIKQNKTKAIDMRFYWLKDRQEQQQFDIYWAPGQVNQANYFTKHHPPTHHRALRPIYLFYNNKQLDMQGCIKILRKRATTGKRSSPGSMSVTNPKPNYQLSKHTTQAYEKLQ